MKSKSVLRALIINQINLGFSEYQARCIIVEKYPEQAGEIWTLSLERLEYVISDHTDIRTSFILEDVISIEDPTEDLDVTILNDIIEDEKNKEIDLPKAVKRNKNKMQKLFLGSKNKSVGHITAVFITEFKLNLHDAYNNALIIIADYDKKRLRNPEVQCF